MFRDWSCYCNLTCLLEVIFILWCKLAFVAALQKNSSGFTTTCNFSDGSVYTCEHGGLCGPNKTCHCQSGYYGHSCEDQVVTTVIVVLICVMPPICWTVLCIYGCKNYDSSQRQRQMDSGSRSFHTDDESVPAGINDQPPCYNDVTNPFHHSIRSHHIDHCGNTDHPPAYDEVMKAFRSIKNSRKSSKVNTSTISLGSKNSAFSFELDDIEMAQEV
ncbi:uncharacterized protein LOC117104919 [Anneissia japonica]|uniref:uncharacterized protein LOC117104919 n=1 Tax=Anneissia japonica TaxID=1529436 RepID=UPI001425813B|nr:uncharacterized protein LOC117104919 [Anneissia japonica]XP_033101756.1 uncharacterized protein LOC117104919 [Anneissia japonica]XP_033101766.1 uncharacterized protein LOC117104919 [Anneissia japonica]XP_033101776.1 uncharacterized protein LOC117104919 [Anneissia japonica]